ncbi:kelch repeat and BTB domain-containing protein 8-like isoform X2 [Branchiostoma floridae]|uniref:Kelch repeat and BTB domain-containing protein 8-like isoform X2 n=1 Tax=Branchiostoma floridae TaxID=7739 RepID=A0A9J7LA88_BRAFL|nr:kelch repeat and BTB domain-containing protein 8-like isoform X2 [Branchiostoma floridae]
MNRSNYAHAGEVLRELNSQRERAELTDVVLEVGGRSFPCHRAILASCSPYFRGMFTSGYAEAKQERISIQDVSPVAMATILDYIYDKSGCLQSEPDQVQAVMSAARLLQVDFVCKEAAEYMKNHLDVSNCTDVLMYADMLGDLVLVDYCATYIASRFDQVALQPSFLQLPLALLQSLLTRDDLLTNSEDNVVQAALRWVEFDQEVRLRHLPTLCSSFRRSFLSSKQLVDLEKKCPSTDIRLDYSDSTTQRLGQERTEMQIFLREPDSVCNYSAPCYDPSTGRLYTMNKPHSIFGYSMAVTPGDELYVAGGLFHTRNRRDEKPKNFLEYNHLLDTWEPRCALVYLKGYIYAIGGDDAKETAERYDPSRDEWTSIPPLPRPVSSELCAVALGDCVYVISQEGCYSFSVTDNTWSKTSDMVRPPLYPQAISHRGSIYCIDCVKRWGDSSSTRVEVYNPAQGKWRQPGKTSFTFRTATLLEYDRTIYLFTLNSAGLQDQRKDGAIDVFQYQPNTDSWLLVVDTGRLVPPMRGWLVDLGSPDCLQVARTDCLTARMVPKGLSRDPSGYKERSRQCRDWLGGNNTFSDSSGSKDGSEDDVSDHEDSEDNVSDHDDSEDDVSDHEDSEDDVSDHDDNSDEDRESGSDDANI